MRRHVATARVARFATVGAGGRPHLVPLCFALDGESLVWAVDAKRKSTFALRRLQNLATNPAVSVLVDHYDDDWTRLWWVRLDGLARVVDEPAARAAVVRALQAKYEQYRRGAPEGPAVVVEITGWRGWAASG